MSSPDFTLLQTLGISQGTAAKALGYKQPSVSEGMSKPYDYFDSKKLAKIREHLLGHDPSFDAEAFDRITGEFLSDSSSFVGSFTTLDADPSRWAFDQLLTIGYQLKESTSQDFVDKLLAGRMLLDGCSLIYAVPDIESGRIIFNVLADQLKEETVLDVYLLQMPSAAFFPELRIVDPLSDKRRAYSRLFDNSLGRLDGDAAIPFVKMFRSNGIGLSSSNFFGDYNRVLQTPQFSTLAGPDDFRRAKFPTHPQDLRAMA